MEAENVFAKSLVEKHKFDVDVILSEKEQIIRKSGILEYYPFNEQISDVGGLDLLKDWMEKRTVAFTEKARDFGLPAPRGVLLLGVQGCGKSLSAKAIGALWRLPLLRLDVGRIFGGIVGQSEENMRKAIRVAESVAPCVSGETRITLADGSERPISELYNDADSLEVLSMTPDYRLAATRVRAITRREAPDLFAVKTAHGLLNATSNHQHPVLRDGDLHWVRTDELQTTDCIAISLVNPAIRAVAMENEQVADIIPVGGKLIRVVQAARQLLLSKGDVSLEKNKFDAGCASNPTRLHLCMILEELGEKLCSYGHKFAELSELAALAWGRNIGWSRVQSVTQIETPQYVYDLCCEENHNFIANGLITHNCVLWLDELEKGFSGTQSSGQSDGGTTSRVFGTFLTWMQDKKAATFVVATSNDVTSLPPELLRKGRFDDIFFIDLPSKGERVDIFHIHLGKRKRNPDDFDLNRLADATPGFSGAEIEAVVIEALYNAFDDTTEMTTDSIITAARQTVPLSMTMRERIEDLREWAEQRARQASSAQSENMATIAEELIVAKHNDAVSSAIAASEAIAPVPLAQTDAPQT